MKVKFINNDKFLEITEVTTTADVKLLENAASAIPMYWKNKRQVKGDPICYVKSANFNKYMPAGLWNRLLKLQQAGHNIQFENFMQQDTTITKEWIDKFIEDLGAIYTLATHQLNAVYTALRFRQTACAIGTSGGKTFIAFALASILLRQHNYSSDKKYLVIVPSQLLCIQGHSDFAEFMSTMDDPHLKVHMIFSGAKNTHKLAESNVVFATYQSLSNMTMLDGFFDQFQYVYVDEAHRSVDAVKNIMKYMDHVVFRNAFSGSFPESHTVEMLNIETFIGPLLYEFKTAKLRDAGFTSDFAIVPVEIIHKAEDTRAYFTMLKQKLDLQKEYNKMQPVFEYVAHQKAKIAQPGTLYPQTLDEMLKGIKDDSLKFIDQDSYQALIVRSKELMELDAHKDINRRMLEEEYLFTAHNRHKVLAHLVGSLDKNTLILSRRRNDVKGLYDAGVEYAPHKQCHLIMGGISNADKISSINEVKEDEDFSRHAVYGNVDMIGTGTSIKSLFYALFAGIGKSPYTAIQTVGRMIRKFHAKTKSFVFDSFDTLECDVPGIPSAYKRSYSSAHATARLQIFAAEDYEIMHDKKITLRT
ncbi:DEAD/DEAH box helicase family protein [Chryseobacterium phage MA9V-2]|nr:DEAD/DEAH box helicase family protein [Chryseobacterium phage MA9V-2]